MKRLIILCFIAAAPSVYGYENCIITSESPITAINNKTPDIISIQELTTIMNDKNTIIIECKKNGNGNFTITSGDKESEFRINITENKTELSTVKGYSGYILDMAPGVFELDLPPIPPAAKITRPSKGITAADSLDILNEE